jgi:hypothetical protein
MAGTTAASSSPASVVGLPISKYESFLQSIPNRILVIIPLILPLCLLIFVLVGDSTNYHHHSSLGSASGSSSNSNSSTDRRHIVGYIIISILGYIMTQQLIPHISLYTLRKNIYGKDLGKKNTSTADVPM